MNKNIKFSSVLGPIINDYILEKQSLGYKYSKGSKLMKKFDDFLINNNYKMLSLSKEIVLKWTNPRLNESKSTRSGRISAIRGLAKYMTRLEYNAYIYPPKALKISRYSYIPYIFSKDELIKVFTICDNYPISKFSLNRHFIIKIIYKLLYCTGLRVSEAVNLKIENVDLDSGLLFIKNTKFNKERIIPVSKSLLIELKTYYNNVHRFKSINVYFFPSPNGGNYSPSTIYKLFREILWDAGISHSGKGPRLHDLRHTFTVHCLKKWVENNDDLIKLLPYLSTYLGHSDLRGTQHYLRLTSDLYPKIKSKVENYCSGIIPEVFDNEKK